METNHKVVGEDLYEEYDADELQSVVPDVPFFKSFEICWLVYTFFATVNICENWVTDFSHILFHTLILDLVWVSDLRVVRNLRTRRGGKL